MSSAGVNKSLLAVLLLLVVSTASAPFVRRLSYGDWNGSVILLVLSMSLPVMACVGWTLLQERRGRTGSASFDSTYLGVGGILIAASTVAICLLALVGAFLSFVLVPIATAMLALAWVQPDDMDIVVTTVLGLALAPLIAWFVGRADEYAREAVISGGCIVATLAVLGWLRRKRSIADSTAGT